VSKKITVKYMGGKPEVIWNGIVFKKEKPKTISLQDDWILPENFKEVKETKTKTKSPEAD